MKTATSRLLREAAEWRLIGMLFEYPDEDWRTGAAQLAAEINDPELESAAATAREEASASIYGTTFGPGGPASPREAGYRGSTMPGQLLGDLGGFYQAFAYAPSIPEAPDHVAVEAGFVDPIACI